MAALSVYDQRYLLLPTKAMWLFYEVNRAGQIISALFMFLLDANNINYNLLGLKLEICVRKLINYKNTEAVHCSLIILFSSSCGGLRHFTTLTPRICFDSVVSSGQFH